VHEPPPDTSPEPEVKTVVAAVIQRGDRFLICRRPEGKNHGGLWEFPGGKVDAGESVVEAVRRELQEELAVEATHVGSILFSVHDQKSGFEIQFMATAVAGDPVALEHTHIAWSSRSELLSYSLAPSDRAFATFIVTHAT
jgi:mutator protein MutT